MSVIGFVNFLFSYIYDTFVKKFYDVPRLDVKYVYEFMITSKSLPEIPQCATSYESLD